MGDIGTLFPDMGQYFNNAYEPLLTGEKTPETIAKELEAGARIDAKNGKVLLASPGKEDWRL